MIKYFSQIFTHFVSNIVYVIAHVCLIIFIIANMIIVSIKLSKTNLVFYLILFFLSIILSILGGILICYIRRNNDETKQRIKTLTIVALVITILFLVLTIVEEIIISIEFSKIKSECFTGNILTQGFSQDINITGCIDSYFLTQVKNYTYFVLTFIEIISIISIIYWIYNKKEHVDKPTTQTGTQNVNIVQQAVVPNYVAINPNKNNVRYILVNPGQPISSNYYLQQGVVAYGNNQMLYNNNVQGQQYIQNNNNPPTQNIQINGNSSDRQVNNKE